jgi:dolichol-phosphate mannosyltransferase
MSETPRPLLSIVVPIKDEIETLPELTRRLSEVLVGELADAEIVFVDDGSRDGSARGVAERHRNDGRVRLVRLSRNFGHQAAVTAGLAHARGRAVVLMDGDLQDPPETIPALVARWREGNEIVHTVKTRRRESWPRRLAFGAFYRLIGAMSHDTDLPAQAGLFSLLDRRVVDELDRMPERNRYLAGLRSWVGFRQGAVEYERDARFSGAPRVSVAKLFRLAFDGIFSFSNLPLRLATLLGLTVSLAAFLLMITVVWLRLFTDRAILGWASLMTSVLFLGGVILVTIGIIGEYTGRIYDEVKRRPLYIVAERIGVGAPESESGDRRL